jgi:hypothetical protein
MLARGALLGINPYDILRADTSERDVYIATLERAHEMAVDYLDYLANRVITELSWSMKGRRPANG